MKQNIDTRFQVRLAASVRRLEHRRDQQQDAQQRADRSHHFRRSQNDGPFAGGSFVRHSRSPCERPSPAVYAHEPIARLRNGRFEGRGRREGEQKWKEINTTVIYVGRSRRPARIAHLSLFPKHTYY